MIKFNEIFLRKSSNDEIFFLDSVRSKVDVSISSGVVTTFVRLISKKLLSYYIRAKKSQNIFKTKIGYLRNLLWIDFDPRYLKWKLIYVGIQVPNGCSSEKALKLKLDQTHFWTIENFANKRCILAKLWSKFSLKPVNLITLHPCPRVWFQLFRFLG